MTDLIRLIKKAEQFARSSITSDPASRVNIEANALIEEIRHVLSQRGDNG